MGKALLAHAAALAFVRTAFALPQTISGLGPSAYTVPGAFPTSLYASYYNDPTATSAEPQPVVSDPVTHKVYPYWLTNPDTIPQENVLEAHPLPSPATSEQFLETAFAQIVSITSNPMFANDTCTQCQASLEVAKFLAMAAPEQVPNLAVQLCEYFDYATTLSCQETYGIYTLGSPITQVLAYTDAGGYDGQSICSTYLSLCPTPPPSPLNLTTWFAKPKPDPLPAPKQATGERLKILHISDFHIDPRYAIGSEANCSQYLCCREQSYNTHSVNLTTQPAPRFGAYSCDSPFTLIAAALEAIPVVTDTSAEAGFNFTIYTGDLVPHDPANELSREFTLYAETVLFDLIKRTLNTGPMYAVLGNHDTYNQAQTNPYNIPGGLSSEDDWNYDYLAALWELEGWLSPSEAQQARKTYGAYSVQRGDGLRIITLNTDFWYTSNYYNNINLASSDNSGMLRFLTDELQDAEDAEDRVWILGHVPSGWSGSYAMNNPSNLFYQIVDRFSPHVIAAIFFGHTHEDQLSIFYTNNATNISAENALTVSWITPSVTPLTNLNSGFRVYEVDSGTFDILDAYTWAADVNTFGELDGQTEFGPAFEFEYSTREAYGQTITEWGPNDPLNATWWHLVTEAMEANSSLVELFTTYQGKSSVKTAACTGKCIPARICYMRSGSTPIAHQNCISGHGSVQ
ncbi:Metallo-dependent phosphatase [Laetiporus sulphureus 93-53]|uniref:Sphingomyelin phosphodiesterase n=1 Tax=Laetiporus sulphureus 93-53 TaxID=1314785 RepID=A0A165ESL7_9APHY|nr:Metallo-dependent phosphatase [Laetiporus sulphureus 93-53]KZT07673.1 Metallo-dependent phosphatase [Laetiporus sulphureus 93-53]